MDEVLARASMDQGATHGVIQDRGRWQLHIQNVREPERTLTLGSAWELKEVTIAVRLMDGGREREIELKTFKLVRKTDS
jgi:hypothetical protein